MNNVFDKYKDERIRKMSDSFLNYSKKKKAKMENRKVYMKVKCEKCGDNWIYHGKSKWYLACPKCKNTINIYELKEKERIRRNNNANNRVLQ